MANEVKILISAVDKASATLNKVQGELKQTGQVGKTSFMGMAGGALAAVGGIAAIGAAVGTAAKFVQGSINDWANYNEEIRKLSIATGAAPDQFSRLIQAADDAGVSIGAMETSLRLASRQMPISVQSIAALSDELKGMENVQERNAKMQKLFGRGWAEIVPFILSGSDAIEKGSAAISDGLIVTEESIKQSREYKIAIDNLNDSWIILRNNVGSKALPVVTEGVKVFNEVTEAAMHEDNILTNLTKAVFGLKITYFDAAAILALYTSGTIDNAKALDLIRLKSGEVTTAVQKQNEKLDSATVKTGEFAAANEAAVPSIDKNYAAIMGVAGALGVLSSQQEKARKSGEKLTAGLIEKEVKFKVGFQLPDITSELANWVKSDEWRKAGGELVLQSYIDLTPRIAAMTAEDRENIATKLAGLELAAKISIGEMSKADAQKAITDAFGKDALPVLNAAIAIDTVDTAAIDEFLAADTYAVSVKTLKEETSYKTMREDLEKEAEPKVKPKLDVASYNLVVDTITTALTIPVKVALGGTGLSSIAQKELQKGMDLNGNGIIGAARGLSMRVPPGYPNDSFLVGVTSGETVDVRTPGQQRGGSSVMIGSVNVYAQRGQSPTAIAQAVVAQLNTAMKSARRSGLGYTG